MRFTLLIASLVCASCIVPIDIPRPGADGGSDDAGLSEDAGNPLEEDGGVDAGDSGIDAGADAGIDAGADAGIDAGADAGVDAGVPVGPCSVPVDLGRFFARSPRSFVFPGCANSGFSADPEVGLAVIPGTDGSAFVRLTPSTLGAWTLTIVANGSTTTRLLLTDENFDLDAGYAVRYPDRIDVAVRTITPSGRLLVAAFGAFKVYGTDGGFEQTIPGNSSPVAWAGNTLLLVPPQAPVVERWVETPAGLVSEGTIDAAGTTSCVLCRVEENRLISVYGTDVVATTWDGGVVVSRQTLTSGLSLPAPLNAYELLLYEGPDRVWAENLCVYEPGCTSTVCAAIESCIGFKGASRVVHASDSHAVVWNGSGEELQLWEVPLSNRRQLDARPGRGEFTNPSREGPIGVVSRVPGGSGMLAEVVVHRNRLFFRYFDSEVIVTRDWVVKVVSPRELRFIHR